MSRVTALHWLVSISRFEQGYKAQITGQLKQLRDQQNSITDTLEELRDKCDEEEEDNAQEVSVSKHDGKTVLSLCQEVHTMTIGSSSYLYILSLLILIYDYFPSFHHYVQWNAGKINLCYFVCKILYSMTYFIFGSSL